MVRMFVRHAVEHFDIWKQAYDSLDDEREGWGVRGHAVFRAVDDQNDVTVWHDFDSLGEARELAESEWLQEVMGEAGVVGEPTIWYTERV